LDNDGDCNNADNCWKVYNPAQDDTDLDDCGNVCDADYDQSGIVGFPDFGEFVGAFASTAQEFQHVEPIGASEVVGFLDFGVYVGMFGRKPGPSGTTVGTTACESWQP
jgi:hypothetical protein